MFVYEKSSQHAEKYRKLYSQIYWPFVFKKIRRPISSRHLHLKIKFCPHKNGIGRRSRVSIKCLIVTGFQLMMVSVLILTFFSQFFQGQLLEINWIIS